MLSYYWMLTIIFIVVFMQRYYKFFKSQIAVLYSEKMQYGNFFEKKWQNSPMFSIFAIMLEDKCL